MNELSTIAWVALTAAVVAVAFLYSSVGHGGATGYLAVLALAGVAPDSARAAALLTNCFVAGVAWWRFRQAGHFNLRVLLLLVATSVPCAWIGSRVAFGLPGKPAAVRECLEILAPAVAEGVALLRGEDPHLSPANPSEKP